MTFPLSSIKILTWGQSWSWITIPMTPTAHSRQALYNLGPHKNIVQPFDQVHVLHRKSLTILWSHPFSLASSWPLPPQHPEHAGCWPLLPCRQPSTIPTCPALLLLPEVPAASVSVKHHKEETSMPTMNFQPCFHQQRLHWICQQTFWRQHDQCLNIRKQQCHKCSKKRLEL